MSFILDSSVALSWCLPDEGVPETMRVLDEARRSTIVVPVLWHIEMANILGIGIRKGRLSPSDLTNALDMLSALDLHTEAKFHGPDIPGLLRLMQVHSLTAYDASYLHLAVSRHLPLATLDAEQANAAKEAGVPLLCQSS